jgi:D-serine deaminase-like pyridoxal phosphate-dependent protein
MLKQFSASELLGKPLTDQQKREILALVDKGDEDIDLSDIPEIDFSKGTRGKFHRADTIFRVPIYLDAGLHEYLATVAGRKGVTLTELVNDLLGKEIAIVESVK